MVLTDIRMPPSQTDEGIRAADAIRAAHPEIGVVVLSQYVEPEYARRLFEHGSDGRAYLLKERVADLDELGGAIRRVADGGSVVDPKVVEALIGVETNCDSVALDRLTERERDVLAEMAAGKSNSSIGEALFISARSVEKHINAIFTKLDLVQTDDVHRRVQAVLVFLGLGMPVRVDPTPESGTPRWPGEVENAMIGGCPMSAFSSSTISCRSARPLAWSSR